MTEKRLKQIASEGNWSTRDVNGLADILAEKMTRDELFALLTILANDGDFVFLHALEAKCEEMKEKKR